MIRFKRFLQAIQEYRKSGKAGDIAFLKVELLIPGTSAEIVSRMQGVAGYAPTINLDELIKLPKGTFGYEYASHMRKYQLQPLEISSDFKEYSKNNPFPLRYIATHDIHHVLLGFDTSLAGEIGVLAFTQTQKYNRIFNFTLPLAKVLYPLFAPSQTKVIFANAHRGKLLGKQAQFLLNYHFEDNWQRPIDEVRKELGISC